MVERNKKAATYFTYCFFSCNIYNKQLNIFSILTQNKYNDVIPLQSVSLKESIQLNNKYYVEYVHGFI